MNARNCLRQGGVPEEIAQTGTPTYMRGRCSNVNSIFTQAPSARLFAVQTAGRVTFESTVKNHDHSATEPQGDAKTKNAGRAVAPPASGAIGNQRPLRFGSQVASVPFR